MFFTPEFAIATVLAVLLILYVLTRFMNSRPGYLARKTDILDQFQSLRNKSRKLQDELSNLVLSQNMAQEILTGNITYKDYLKSLQRNHIQNLSDKNYARIKNTNNRIILKQAQDMLIEQDAKLEDAAVKLNSRN